MMWEGEIRREIGVILGVLSGVRICIEKWEYLGIFDGEKLDGSREGDSRKSADK